MNFEIILKKKISSLNNLICDLKLYIILYLIFLKMQKERKVQ